MADIAPAPCAGTRGLGCVFDDNSFSIGRTPLVRLNRVTDDVNARVLAKMEGRNPAYSVKCRIGAAMIWDAERTGRLKAGMELVEPTSGNTGIALAFVCAARGYKLTLTMPAAMSIERQRVLRMLGANLELIEDSLSMQAAVDRARELADGDPQRYLMLQQFENPANPQIHVETTGPELWDDTSGDIDVFVAGVGTGGTISGVSRYFKEVRNKKIISVAVEPETSAVISQTIAGERVRPGHHRIQGIGAGFVPRTLDLGMIDRVETVSDDEALCMARRLAREEGMLVGISCGAAAAVACRLAAEPEFEDKTIAVVLPDAGERYLSSALYAGV